MMMMMMMIITFINHDPDHDDNDEAMTAETIRIHCFPLVLSTFAIFMFFPEMAFLTASQPQAHSEKTQEDEQNAKATAPQTNYRFC